MKRALRPYVTAGIAVLGTGIIAVPAAAPPMPDARGDAVRLVSDEDNVALIIGGSGNPIPGDDYVNTNDELYIQRLFEGQGYDSQALFTPEGNYALYTGVKSLTLDESEAQGVTILKDAVEKQLAGGADHVAVLGDSQSSTISSLTMPELEADGIDKEKVDFVLLADPNQPNGGLFERLDGMTIPSLGITFNGATPDDLYPTTIYMQAYDGFADIPRYPINLVSDLNSLLGIQYVHPTYQDLTSEQLDSATELDTVGDTSTTYYALPTEDLPLLEPLRAIPAVGTPLADFLQPILTPLVNLGYGDPDYGWSTDPANVPTEFGLFPEPDMVLKTVQEMVAGIPTGFQAAMEDFGSMDPPDLSSMLDPSSASDPLSGFTDIVNTLTGAFSTAYAALLPTADVITGVTTTIPAYDVQWFLDGLQDGDLISAIFKPIANSTYLYSLAAGFEFFALLNTFETVGDDLSGLF